MWEIVFSISYFWAKLKMDDFTGKTDESTQVKQRAAELRYDALAFNRACLQS